jgi:DNA-binding CsgD family transcriptional regulator
LRPAAIRTFLIGEIAFRGKPASFLVLCRQGRGRGFGTRDREILRSLRNALGVVEAAFCAVSPSCASNLAPGILSPRESQVASLVVRGLQNKEIAAVLGTSPETVRKQTSRIYAKTGAPGRVRLAALFAAEMAPAVDASAEGEAARAARRCAAEARGARPDRRE